MQLAAPLGILLPEKYSADVRGDECHDCNQL